MWGSGSATAFTCLVLKGSTVLSRIHVSMGSGSPLPLQGMMILLVPSTAKYSVGRLSASRGWTEGGREGGRERWIDRQTHRQMV